VWSGSRNQTSALRAASPRNGGFVRCLLGCDSARERREVNKERVCGDRRARQVGLAKRAGPGKNWRCARLRARGRYRPTPELLPMPAELTGPRLDPESAPAKRLVVFCTAMRRRQRPHRTRPAVAEIVARRRFVSPHAPERCAGAPTGRNGSGSTSSRPTTRAARMSAGAASFRRGRARRFLDAELARLGLDDSRLALVGFSQGSMMALHVGLAPPRAGGDRRLFWHAVGPNKLGEAKARNARGEPRRSARPRRPGSVIPLEAMLAATDDLARAEIPNQWHLSFGIGHGIDAGGLRQAACSWRNRSAPRRAKGGKTKEPPRRGGSRTRRVRAKEGQRE